MKLFSTWCDYGAFTLRCSRRICHVGFMKRVLWHPRSTRVEPALFCLCILSIICLFSLVGCGKKGDPLPPIITLPAPPQLTYSLDSDNATVMLRWTASSSETMELFRARVRLSADACKRCPLQFEKIASLPSSISEYRESLERGFIYFYRIKSYTGSNRSGSLSETVELEFK